MLLVFFESWNIRLSETALIMKHDWLCLVCGSVCSENEVARRRWTEVKKLSCPVCTVAALLLPWTNGHEHGGLFHNSMIIQPYFIIVTCSFITWDCVKYLAYIWIRENINRKMKREISTIGINADFIYKANQIIFFNDDV